MIQIIAAGEVVRDHVAKVFGCFEIFPRFDTGYILIDFIWVLQQFHFNFFFQFFQGNKSVLVEWIVAQVETTQWKLILGLTALLVLINQALCKNMKQLRRHLRPRKVNYGNKLILTNDLCKCLYNGPLVQR